MLFFDRVWYPYTNTNSNGFDISAITENALVPRILIHAQSKVGVNPDESVKWRIRNIPERSFSIGLDAFHNGEIDFDYQINWMNLLDPSDLPSMLKDESMFKGMHIRKQYYKSHIDFVVEHFGHIDEPTDEERLEHQRKFNALTQYGLYQLYRQAGYFGDSGKEINNDEQLVAEAYKALTKIQNPDIDWELTFRRRD